MTPDEFMEAHRDHVLTAIRCMVTVAHHSGKGMDAVEGAQAVVADAETLMAEDFLERYREHLLDVLQWIESYCLWYHPERPDDTNPEHRLYFAWGGKTDWPRKFETRVWQATITDMKGVPPHEPRARG